MRAWIAGAVVTIVALPAIAESWIVYERAGVAAAIGGRVEIRRRFEAPVDLPARDCGGDDEFSCLRERNVRQLYELSFIAERLMHDAEDGGRREREPLGRIQVATELSKDDELALETAIETALGDMVGDSFRLPHAGWGREAPLDLNHVAGRSADLAWVCLQPADGDQLTEFRYQHMRDEDGEITGSSSHSSTTGVTDRDHVGACSGLAGAFADRAEPDVVAESSLFVDSLQVTRVMSTTEWFPGSGDRRLFHPLPEGTRYQLLEVPDRNRGMAGMTRHDDGAVEVMSQRDGVKREADVGDAAVEPPTSSSTAFVADVTIETLTRRYDVVATDVVDRSERVRMLALPVRPTVVGGAEANLLRPNDRDVEPLDLQTAEGWSARAAETFRGTGEIDGELVVDSLVRWANDGVSDAWLLVFCFDEKPARYALTPFYATFAVENGRRVCDAAERLYRLNP